MTSEKYIVKGLVIASGDVEVDVYANDAGWTTEGCDAKVFDDDASATIAAAECATQSVAGTSYWHVEAVPTPAPDPRDARITALEEEITNLKATIAVREGEWCRGNREEGRGGCGVCPWCMRAMRDEVERLRACVADDARTARIAELEAENAALKARLVAPGFVAGDDALAVSCGGLRVGDLAQIPAEGGWWNDASKAKRGEKHVVVRVDDDGEAVFSGFWGDVGHPDYPVELVKRRGEP